MASLQNRVKLLERIRLWMRGTHPRAGIGGNRIHIWDEVDSTAVEPNSGLLNSEDGTTGGELHLKGYIIVGSYPYLGIGTGCPGAYNRDWFDFTALTSICFRAKGHGSLRVDIVADTVLNSYSEEDNWGTLRL